MELIHHDILHISLHPSLVFSHLINTGNQKCSCTHEKNEEEIPPAAIRENKKEGGSTSVANITTSSSSLSTPLKPQKKKVKVKKW